MSLPTPLMNRKRAEDVMLANGVAAMVLCDPTNIYHATGFWPQTVAMGQLGTTFAVVPASQNAPVILITGQFHHYLFDLDEAEADGPLAIYLYTSPSPEPEGGAAPPTFFHPYPGGTPDPFERLTRKSTLQQLQRNPAYAGTREALGDALSGVEAGGMVAYDIALPPALLNDDFKWCLADPMLRRIRMIKSPQEIALMRRAAVSNAEAAVQSVQKMSAGCSYDDLRAEYYAETVRRGGIPLFLMIDSVAFENSDGKIREGRSFMIDAVSHYAHYHGDFGRTVCVGEPGHAMRSAMAAAAAANEAIARTLRPGIRYHDVMVAGRDAVREAGLQMATPSSPHSIGLFHTDEAFKDDVLHFAKDDHLIEKDMILSVDCPILETDIGGTVHLEDLWLITEDGCEALNDTSEPVIRI